MLTQEDIDAFYEQNREAMTQADEFARRAEKGLPTDRFGSANDMLLVARGIRALQTTAKVMAAYLHATSEELQQRLQENEELVRQNVQRGTEAMEPSADPMRD